jgi:hypothetical protein
MDQQRERAELEIVLASTLFLRAPDLCGPAGGWPHFDDQGKWCDDCVSYR